MQPNLSMPAALAEPLERYLGHGTANVAPADALVVRRGRGFALIAALVVLAGGVIPSLLQGAYVLALVALAVLLLMVGGIVTGIVAPGRFIGPTTHLALGAALWGIITAGIYAESGGEAIGMFAVLLILVATYVLGMRAAAFWTTASIVGVGVIVGSTASAEPGGTSLAELIASFSTRATLLLAVYALARGERQFADRQTHDLHYLARHDALTGLYNRRALDERLREAVARARRYERRVAVIVIDLDRFKAVNDRHGHEAGDALLRNLGMRIAGLMRATDTASRIGGDEFVVLLEDVEEDKQVLLFADRLLAALTRPVREERLELEVGASLGISTYPDDGGDGSALLREADLAMYAAKSSGGGVKLRSGST